MIVSFLTLTLRKWTDFIFAFASAVTLAIVCLSVNRSSYVSSYLARNVCIMINRQFVLCKFLFLALLLNVCNALVKYHIFPEPDIDRWIYSFRVWDIVDSSSILSMTREFGEAFIYEGFYFLKIFEFSSWTASSAPLRSTFFMSSNVCIRKLIGIIPPLFSLRFRWHIKLSRLARTVFT